MGLGRVVGGKEGKIGTICFGSGLDPQDYQEYSYERRIWDMACVLYICLGPSTSATIPILGC